MFAMAAAIITGGRAIACLSLFPKRFHNKRRNLIRLQVQHMCKFTVQYTLRLF